MRAHHDNSADIDCALVAKSCHLKGMSAAKSAERRLSRFGPLVAILGQIYIPPNSNTLPSVVSSSYNDDTFALDWTNSAIHSHYHQSIINHWNIKYRKNETNQKYGNGIYCVLYIIYTGLQASLWAITCAIFHSRNKTQSSTVVCRPSTTSFPTWTNVRVLKKKTKLFGHLFSPANYFFFFVHSCRYSTTIKSIY